ncbi:pentapeptide repeat-containing protein [Nocardia sp. CWNU-33]|uniref:pentapeptide repeat-containing protein n=1 Tax=Nocardia sp. CWNU-33 TaxID=3392117 RepID=UPI00398E4043
MHTGREQPEGEFAVLWPAFPEQRAHQVDVLGYRAPEVHRGLGHVVGADLTSANLTDAYLTGAKLSGADLSGANLTGVIASSLNNIRFRCLPAAPPRRNPSRRSSIVWANAGLLRPTFMISIVPVTYCSARRTASFTDIEVSIPIPEV